jgi:hypothetical protein
MLYVKDIELIILKEHNIQLLIDCDLLAKVYINLIDQKEPTLDFQNQENEKIKKKKKKKFYILKKLLNLF